jgi:hypothetical protein
MTPISTRRRAFLLAAPALALGLGPFRARSA